MPEFAGHSGRGLGAQTPGFSGTVVGAEGNLEPARLGSDSSDYTCF